MKVGLKTIFFFGDDNGFADAISGALHPPPNSSIRIIEESFELNMYRYKDRKAAGRIVHFVDDAGIYQVSILRLRKYKIPVLAWVLSTVLQYIIRDESSEEVTIVFPFLLPSSEHKRDCKCIESEEKGSSLYGVCLGPETGVSQALAAKSQKPPPIFHISHKPLARVLHLAFVLIGQEGQKQDLELINQIGELLVDDSCLAYSKDKLVWSSSRRPRKN